MLTRTILTTIFFTIYSLSFTSHAREVHHDLEFIKEKSDFHFSLSETEEIIVQSLNIGDVNKLGNYFDKEIYLILPPDTDDFLKKKEALKVLRNFFRGNQSVSFELLFKGSSATNNAQTITGDLIVNKKTYRTSIFLSDDHILEMSLIDIF